MNYQEWRTIIASLEPSGMFAPLSDYAFRRTEYGWKIHNRSVYADVLPPAAVRVGQRYANVRSRVAAPLQQTRSRDAAPLLLASGAGVRAGAPQLNVIEVADCIEYMRRLPSTTVDLIVTSPPYNMGATLNGATPCSKSDSNWGLSALLSGGYDMHDDAMPYEEYVTWQRNVLTECMRILRNDGAIFYNHKWRIQGGLLVDRSEIVAGFPVRQIIIWNRGGSNNHNKAFFAPSYEVVYLIAKRDFYIKQDATAYGDVWHIPPETNNIHPAPFPLELAERCIASTTAKIVFDPFMGSGTVAVAARLLNRDFYGCDQSADYCEIARQRVASVYGVREIATQADMFAA